MAAISYVRIIRYVLYHTNSRISYLYNSTRFTATKQGAWRAIAAWHALYAKSKLVPLMPAGDISVGYYLYKSMKLFKALKD